jgi:hypothetical protein
VARKFASGCQTSWPGLSKVQGRPHKIPGTFTRSLAPLSVAHAQKAAGRNHHLHTSRIRTSDHSVERPGRFYPPRQELQGAPTELRLRTLLLAWGCRSQVAARRTHSETCLVGVCRLPRGVWPMMLGNLGRVSWGRAGPCYEVLLEVRRLKGSGAESVQGLVGLCRTACYGTRLGQPRIVTSTKETPFRNMVANSVVL